MSRRAWWVCAGLVLGAAYASDASAWDTYRTEDGDWRSIYDQVHTGSYAVMPWGNEHPEIADAVLYAISKAVGDQFGVYSRLSCKDPLCPATPTVVDLNASFMRPELLASTVPGDDPNTVLEERRLPPLAMWAGLADFNYTVYDWINKSSRCPALPTDADHYEHCHLYEAWLGAGLNSTHMGELAMKVYRRHHAIALELAERAANLRKNLRLGGASGQLPEAHEWYADYVREAEMLALVYETAGQHFLQDRWAIGHMISRWGPGSYEEMIGVTAGNPPKLDQITTLGLLTGIVHGSLAVFGKPDPLSAPLIDYKVSGGDVANVMTYRWASKTLLYSDPAMSTQYGLGDNYYKDVVDDLFDASVLSGPPVKIETISPPKPVKALTQRRALNRCGGDGFRTVIGRFDPLDGTYGAYGLSLPEPDPNVVLGQGATQAGSDPGANPICNDVWATNDAYYEGVRTIAGAGKLLGTGAVHDIVTVVAKAIGSGPAKYTPDAKRVIAPLLFVQKQALVNKRRDERKAKEKNQTVVRYGVESAKNGISFRYVPFSFATSAVEFVPNGNYEVPGYYEPENLDTLPWWSEKPGQGKPSGGMDRAAIDGFFNKARTESWCKTLCVKEKTDETAAVTLKLLRTRGLDQAIAAQKELDPAAKAALTKEADRARAACSYLANRVYKATEPAYPETGSRFERIGDHLPLGKPTKFGATYEPICAYFDKPGSTTNVITTDASDDDKPYFVKPGYVTTPGQAGTWGYAPKSLESWCSMVPVLEIGKVQADPDAVGEIAHDDGNRWLEMVGENVGIKTGSDKVGEVIAVDATGVPRSLDIWDGMKQTVTGGWSYDNQEVWARVPGSLQGFDTNAQTGMPPHLIKTLAPKAYTLELIRPDDPAAIPTYRADGQKTVGTYRFLLHTPWVELTNISADGTEATKGLWVTYPAWIRPQSTVLVNAFFTVQNGVYTEIDLAANGVTMEVQDGFTPVIDAQGGVTWVADADKRGVVFSKPGGLPPQVFDGTVAFFFAFH